MLTTLALVLTLTLPSPASAGSDGRFVWSHGSDAIRRDAVGSWLDVGEVWTAVLSSDGSGTFEGVLAYAPEPGLLYIQGGTTTQSVVAVGLCAETEEGSECPLRMVSLSDDQCLDGTAMAYWQPSKTGKEQQYFSITVEKDWDTGSYLLDGLWNDASGVAQGDTFFTVDLSRSSSSHDSGDMDDAVTMLGFLDVDETAYLSAFGASMCDAWVLEQEAACSTNASGRLACRGDGELWLNRLGATYSLSFWGYDNMTTVKGFESVTLPHIDGLLVE
mgnify:FL=1